MRFDGVGYKAQTGELIVGEAKSPTARLSRVSRRLKDGTLATQGSTLYFNDVWQSDPNIRKLLQDRTDIATGLADGGITVRYQLFHTAADGEVNISNLVLDPNYLNLNLS